MYECIRRLKMIVDARIFGRYGEGEKVVTNNDLTGITGTRFKVGGVFETAGMTFVVYDRVKLVKGMIIRWDMGYRIIEASDLDGVAELQEEIV